MERGQLSNGISMPQIHLGVYLASGREALHSVRVALEVPPPYSLTLTSADMHKIRWDIERMTLQREGDQDEMLTYTCRVDSAQMYHNEAQCGEAINSFLVSKANTKGLKREDIWFTSKLASNAAYDAARKSITQSVKESGLGYIDLFLLHSPYGGKDMRLQSWKAVEDAIDAGEIKTGGVSNYGIKHVRSQVSSIRAATANSEHSLKSSLPRSLV